MQYDKAHARNDPSMHEGRLGNESYLAHHSYSGRCKNVIVLTKAYNIPSS